MPDEPALIILTRGGKADSKQDAKLARLAALFKDPKAKILLHLHGGLIDQKTGLAIAKRLSGAGANSWNLNSDWTQVYVVWRTGALETLKTNWTELATNDRLYKAIMKRLIDFAARKLGGGLITGRSATGSVPLSDDNIRKFLAGDPNRRNFLKDAEKSLGEDMPEGQRAVVAGPRSSEALALEFQDELKEDMDFQLAIADVDGVANERAAGRTVLPRGDRERGDASLKRLDRRIKNEMKLQKNNRAPAGRGAITIGTFLLGHAAQIASRSFKRFRTGRDHGFHATLVEEVCRELYGDLVGATVWKLMADDAAQHFTDKGFGAWLVKAMTASKARIAVSAHSAGSIWASHLLIAMTAAKLKSKIDLFLLAPAVRQSLFAGMLKASGGLVNQCRMFTMTDEAERADALLGADKKYIYPSSLLYLVSGLFEERGSQAYPDAPILGMQRFFDASWLDPNEQISAKAISRYFQEPGKSIRYGPTKGVTDSKTHGGFDDDPDTLKSIVKLLEG